MLCGGNHTDPHRAKYFKTDHQFAIGPSGSLNVTPASSLLIGMNDDLGLDRLKASHQGQDSYVIATLTPLILTITGSQSRVVTSSLWQRVSPGVEIVASCRFAVVK